MHITFVKKILANGEPCAKCNDVSARLEANGQMARIDAIVIADERDPDSPGMQLAARHGVTRAPFFIVEDVAGTRVYTVYFKFAREVLGHPRSAARESEELLRDNPELDFI